MRKSWLLKLAVALCTAWPVSEGHELTGPPHHYWDRTPKDPVTRLKSALENGEVALDHSSEKAFVMSLLKALDIPVSSQMLVYSTTSLQLSLITPRNPRALFFNEETYLGWVPGGKVEVISIDPELGGIFYIFDVPKGQANVLLDRSRRCMNCHSGPETGEIPGLVIKSVVTAPSGGSLEAFRDEATGHFIPLEQRFGGWYLTGQVGLTNHWANAIGRMREGELTRIPLEPGKTFAWAQYPWNSSDILPQLLHEHQAGFVNRVIEAAYRTRAALALTGGALTSVQKDELRNQAETLTDYLLFKDEAALPAAISGEEEFKAEFRRNAQKTASGHSLKDLNLENRLLAHRCSYMVYSPAVQALPQPLLQLLVENLRRALANGDTRYTHIPAEEKRRIREILTETWPPFSLPSSAREEG